MSVTKSLTVTSPNRSDKLSIKESHFRHDVTKQKKHTVDKSVRGKSVPNSEGGSGSLREDFIQALRVADKSDRTIKAYCDAVKMFQNFMHKNPLDVTVNDIRAFFFI